MERHFFLDVYKRQPTGCPTSQLIALYAYENMFNEIYDVACTNGCIFTVYVDDMTFSAEKVFDVNKMCIRDRMES